MLPGGSYNCKVTHIQYLYSPETDLSSSQGSQGTVTVSSRARITRQLTPLEISVCILTVEASILKGLLLFRQNLLFAEWSIVIY